jgi:hypothetical protein
LQIKQRYEKTLRQIKRDNHAEKTRMGEKPKAYSGRQPCKENKAMRQPYKNKKKWTNPSEGRRPSVIRRNEVIPSDREKTLRKNKKALS